MGYHIGMPRINIEDLYQSSKPKGNGKVIEGSLVGPDGDVQPPKDKPAPYVSHAEAIQQLPATSKQVRIPFGPLRKLAPKDLHSRRDLMEQLNESLPLNESELPTHVYRADMLDFNDFRRLADINLPTEEITRVQSTLDAAAIRLKYHEGYPATPKGEPFWYQLDFEPKDAFGAFLTYQQQGGARSLHEMQGQYDLDTLLDWFHLYYWSLRVQAFDMFKVVRHQKMRLLRALNIEDDHFLLAEKLMTQMKTYFGDAEKFKLGELPPDKAIIMLEKLVKIQRISAGLGEKGGLNEDIMPPKVQSAELIMRQVATPRSASGEDQDSEEFDVLVESPDNIELAQELIIRLNQPKTR